MPAGRGAAASDNTVCEQVNAAVHRARQSMATDIAFQEEAYYQKRAEAIAYLDELPATLDDYPLLKKITAIRGMAPADLANLWITTNSQWGPVLRDTEVIREAAVVAIASAATRPEIDEAIDDLNNALAAI